MEKLTPSCSLSVVRRLIGEGKVRPTTSAFATASALGFDYPRMLEVVLALTPTDFYKSMTTHSNHRVWQDVYRPTTEVGAIYLKLTIIEEVLIVSFKEL